MFLWKVQDLWDLMQQLRNNYFFGIILTWRTPGDDIHRGQFIAVQFCDVPDMEHIGKPFPGHLYGECFDFTGPYRLNAIVKACQGKPADPIEEAPKS